MATASLDHVNIITDDIDRTCEFYRDLLGLERRDAPAPLQPQHAQWMFDPEGRAVLHVNSAECPRLYERAVVSGPTGSIHHVAFRCSDFAGMESRLKQRGADFQVNEFPVISLRQIFTLDPNGVLLELNFFES